MYRVNRCSDYPTTLFKGDLDLNKSYLLSQLIVLESVRGTVKVDITFGSARSGKLNQERLQYQLGNEQSTRTRSPQRSILRRGTAT